MSNYQTKIIIGCQDKKQFHSVISFIKLGVKKEYLCECVTLIEYVMQIKKKN